MLTILGYSIYDTIIIFDRVRENMPLMRRSSFAAIANQSLWETIRRSLATTFITLLPVASLLVFGGDTLKDFAFALLVGIASGAYSTIFIATPLLVVLKEREPEYAKRKDGRPAGEARGVTTATSREPCGGRRAGAGGRASPWRPAEPAAGDGAEAPTPASRGARARRAASAGARGLMAEPGEPRLRSLRELAEELLPRRRRRRRADEGAGRRARRRARPGRAS